jgi:hypothetical protein
VEDLHLLSKVLHQQDDQILLPANLMRPLNLYLVVHDLVVLLVGVEEEVDHQQDDDPLGHEEDAAVQLQLLGDLQVEDLLDLWLRGLNLARHQVHQQHQRALVQQDVKGDLECLVVEEPVGVDVFLLVLTALFFGFPYLILQCADIFFRVGSVSLFTNARCPLGISY